MCLKGEKQSERASASEFIHFVRVDHLHKASDDRGRQLIEIARHQIAHLTASLVSKGKVGVSLVALVHNRVIWTPAQWRSKRRALVLRTALALKKLLHLLGLRVGQRILALRV